MKRTLYILLAVLVLSLPVLLGSCTNACEHVFDESKRAVALEPTCTRSGMYAVMCVSCGAERLVSPDADDAAMQPIGHAPADEPRLDPAPTCTHSGWARYNCRSCGISMPEYNEYMPALGHESDGGSMKTPPTCLSEGLITYACRQCDVPMPELNERVAAKGHTAKEAYYENDGATHATVCADCGVRLTREPCTMEVRTSAEGYVLNVCSVCRLGSRVASTYEAMHVNVMRQMDGWGPEELVSLRPTERAARLAALVRAASPDILLLSERYDEMRGIGADSADLLSCIGAPYAVLEDVLPTGGYTNRVPIVYNTEVFHAVSSGVILLPEEFTYEMSAGKRSVTWAILEDITDSPARGTRIAVFNVHFSAPKSPTTGVNQEYIRTLQAEQLSALLEESRFSRLPILVGGDFKSYLTESVKTPSYQTLLSKGELTDVAWELHTADPTGIPVYDGTDHFAYRGACVPVRFTALDQAAAPFTDHAPLLISLQIEAVRPTSREALCESCETLEDDAPLARVEGPYHSDGTVYYDRCVGCGRHVNEQRCSFVRVTCDGERILVCKVSGCLVREPE